jgi:soluble lytic murein transglycosylase-like protein
LYIALKFLLHAWFVTVVFLIAGMTRFWTLLLILCPLAWPGEYVILGSGFRLRVERHERANGRILLYTAPDAYIELPECAVVSFEQEDSVPPQTSSAPVTAQPAPAAKHKAATPIRELVERSAESQGLPARLVHLVAQAESGYNPQAVSAKGAIGVMQLMPGTAAMLNADPNDPEQNVEAGAKHLRELLLKYQDYPDQLRRALAAYNAGSGAVEKYNGVPPYRETQLYVDRIVDAYRKSQKPAP